MIFEKEVYNNKPFYKEIITRVRNIFHRPRHDGRSNNTYLPLLAKEISSVEELKKACPYEAIVSVSNKAHLDLSKCTMCLDCLSVEGVEMTNVKSINDDIVAMDVKNQNQDEVKSFEN